MKMANMFRITSMLVSALFIWTAFMTGAESATQDYPQRPIRYIVPSAAGGGADVLARVLAAELTKQLGLSLIHI